MSDVIVIDSTVKSIKTSETFEYQPLGPMDVVTKVMASMDLDLKKWSNAHIRKRNYYTHRYSIYIYLFYCIDYVRILDFSISDYPTIIIEKRTR